MGVLELLILVLAILWVGGMATAYTAGGLIHLLLAVIVILIILRLARGESL